MSIFTMKILLSSFPYLKISVNSKKIVPSPQCLSLFKYLKLPSQNSVDIAGISHPLVPFLSLLFQTCSMAVFLLKTFIIRKRLFPPLVNAVIKTERRRIEQRILTLNGIANCRCLHVSPAHRRKSKAQAKKAQAANAFVPKPKEKLPVVKIWKNMTVRELSETSGRTINDVLQAITYSDTNYYKGDTEIENRNVLFDAVRRLGLRYKIIAEPGNKVAEVEKNDDAVKRPPPDFSQTVKRHPVVTIMGHVDHGKTTLLDSLRHTSVVSSEFGGITQHIGAFNVTLDNNERITFLDTPGHAAFSAMRARGANVTDIVILVVAADDGVMDQTVQSIEMARDADVPIIVAINKIDKPQADIERTQKMLGEQGIHVEALGGEIPAVSISALKGTNLKELMETVTALAEVLDLRGDPKGLVEGVVIEVSTQTGRGKLATVIIQRGTLRKGAVLVSGLGWAKVRAMFDHAGNPVAEAKLSEAVQIIGWRELPAAGDEILEVENEHRAHIVMQYRESQQAKKKQMDALGVIEKRREEHNEAYQEKLKQRRASGRYRKLRGPREKEIQDDDGIPRVNVILKADVLGSAEAILDVFDTYGDERRCHLDVVHYGIGPVVESDVELAEAFGAIIYTFNVDTPRKIKDTAEKNGVPVRNHKIIYKLVDDVKAEICKKLPPEICEDILGKANVLQQFEINEKRKKVIVAGCRCTDGTLKKNAMYRIVRGNETIYEGKLASMRHLKDEVASIKSGIECGLRFEDATVTVNPGDEIICFTTFEKASKVHWDPGF